MLSSLRSHEVRTPLYVIPTGIDTDLFNRGNKVQFRGKYGIGKERQVLLFAGRVAAEKNVSFLLRTLARIVTHLPEVLFIVAGGGQQLDSCIKLSIRLGLTQNVMFLGGLDRDTELVDCYAASDIFIFASKTETQGLVLLEAMEMSLPVVSTHHLGTMDTLGRLCGAIIAPDDEDGFAEKGVECLDDQLYRCLIASRGRAYAKRYASILMVKDLFDIYQHIQPMRKETAFQRTVNEISEGVVFILIWVYVCLEIIQGTR